MRTNLSDYFVLMVSLAVAATPAAAHHSFASEFDINRPIELQGVVTRMEFSNPHCWIHLEVTTADGEKQQWKVEGGSPNSLMRRGWNRDSLPPGTVVHIQGYHARDRSFRASGGEVLLENGTRLFVGSSGAGAPSGE